MFHSDPVFLVLLGVLGIITFFTYLLVRRTLLEFREGFRGGGE